MKIAISVFSDSLEGEVNPVFGRCPGYIIVETGDKEIKSHSFIQNQAANAATGAGIAAAQTVVGQGVQAVISGNIGPNASMVLQQSEIKIYQAHGLTVKDSIQQFIDGKLQEMNQPSTPSKFGMGTGRGLGAGKGAGAGAGRGLGRGAGKGRN